MKSLFAAFYRKLAETDMRFERYLKNQIDWNNRFIAITGSLSKNPIYFHKNIKN